MSQLQISHGLQDGKIKKGESKLMYKYNMDNFEVQICCILKLVFIFSFILTCVYNLKPAYFWSYMFQIKTNTEHNASNECPKILISNQPALIPTSVSNSLDSFASLPDYGLNCNSVCSPHCSIHLLRKSSELQIGRLSV